MKKKIDKKNFIVVYKLFRIKETNARYYKQVTIVIYDRNDSVQCHKTTITIIIDNHNS